MPTGNWRAQVCVNGVRRSRVLPTRGDASRWVADVERTLEHYSTHTLHDAFARYERTRSKEKKGHAWESARFAKFKAYFENRPISDITTADIADWRDWRIARVSGATVNRELTLLSAVFSVAMAEWGWIQKHPCKGVRRPKQPPHRTRVFTDEEVERICLALDGGPKSRIVRDVFLFALETGMRAGEILKIQPEHRTGTTIFLHDTKNGISRHVPLSRTAISILERQHFCFKVDGATRDTLFRKAMRRAGVVGATFHDARRTAASRLSHILTPQQLARMLGHKNLGMLMVYYSESPEDVAQLLG